MFDWLLTQTLAFSVISITLNKIQCPLDIRHLLRVFLCEVARSLFSLFNDDLDAVFDLFIKKHSVSIAGEWFSRHRLNSAVCACERERPGLESAPTYSASASQSQSPCGVCLIDYFLSQCLPEMQFFLRWESLETRNMNENGSWHGFVSELSRARTFRSNGEWLNFNFRCMCEFGCL